MPSNRDVHYMHVLSPGPLVIIRTPWPRIGLWRKFAQAVVTMMRINYKVKRADVSSIEGVIPDPTQTWCSEDVTMAGRLDAAFTGDVSVLASFTLYSWDGSSLSLVRTGSDTKTIDHEVL